mmetsp:Transcript_116579/g.202816  ORF Transcript_116579/g.202816 Transcript_116579/m.202816 type:complete len:82 (-) Transcript_116579:313-558(-)
MWSSAQPCAGAFSCLPLPLISPSPPLNCGLDQWPWFGSISFHMVPNHLRILRWKLEGQGGLKRKEEALPKKGGVSQRGKNC